MSCAVHQKLLNDERDSHAAYKSLKDSGSKDQKELIRRSDNASDASTRLRQHISTCPECQPKTDQPKPK
jgi:hypothetical protein